MLKIINKIIVRGIFTVSHLYLVAVDLICVILTANATLISKPVNTFVLAGANTQLSCRTNLTESITWQQRKLTDGRTHVLYTTHILYDYHERKNSDRMHVTRGLALGGWYNLTIKNVSYDDAGVYTCVDDDNIEGAERFSVEFVVLDKVGLQCEHDVDICSQSRPSDSVIIQCYLAYYGNIAPTVRWKMNDTNVINDSRTSYSNWKAGSTVQVYSSTIVIEPSQLLRFSPWTCETVLTNSLGDVSSVSQNNSLGILHNETLDTACLPMNSDTCASEPTDINCTRGSFNWLNGSNVLHFRLDVYPVDDRMRYVARVYHCLHGNITCLPIAQVSHVNEVDNAIIAIVISITAIIAILVMVIFCSRKRRQRSLLYKKRTMEEASAINNTCSIILDNEYPTEDEEDVHNISVEAVLELNKGMKIAAFTRSHMNCFRPPVENNELVSEMAWPSEIIQLTTETDGFDTASNMNNDENEQEKKRRLLLLYHQHGVVTLLLVEIQKKITELLNSGSAVYGLGEIKKLSEKLQLAAMQVTFKSKTEWLLGQREISQFFLSELERMLLAIQLQKKLTDILDPGSMVYDLKEIIRLHEKLRQLFAMQDVLISKIQLLLGEKELLQFLWEMEREWDWKFII